MFLNIKLVFCVLMWFSTCGNNTEEKTDIQVKIVMDREHNMIDFLVKDDGVKAKILNLLKTKKRELALLYGDFFLEVVEKTNKTKIAVCHDHIVIDGLSYVLDGDLGDVIQAYLVKYGKLKYTPFPSECRPNSKQ